MEYSQDEIEQFEDTLADVSGDALELATIVDPDGLVVSDGDETIRLSFGKQVYQVFVEADGYTNTIHTTGYENRITSMEIALEEIASEYASGRDDLGKLALSL